MTSQHSTAPGASTLGGGGVNSFGRDDDTNNTEVHHTSQELPLPRPRSRANATGETSRAAAKLASLTSSETCIAICQVIADRGDATAEEAHAALVKLGHTAVLNTVRARISDMARVSMLAPTTRRGVSDSGRCRSIAWRLTTVTERTAPLEIAQ